MTVDPAYALSVARAPFQVPADIAAALLCEGSAVSPRWVVVTDVDGTLLDYHTYRPGPALSVLRRLESLGIPVVLSTSKTRAEVEALRAELGLGSPFIVENGAAIFVPESTFDDVPPNWDRCDGYRTLSLGMPHREISDVLGELRGRFRFAPFSEMSVPHIVNLTGLSPTDAANARQREFGEPVQWRDGDEALSGFRSALAERGMAVEAGGRFLHVGASGVDKGRALKLLRAEYQNLWRSVTRVIALGDSENDSAMLAAADLAVIIPSPSSQPPDTGEAPTIVADAEGPSGWARVMTALADLYERGAAHG